MANDVFNIDDYLREYAERVPAKGMHLGYMSNAAKLMELYRESLEYTNGPRTNESEAELARISGRMKGIVNSTGMQYEDIGEDIEL